MAHEGGAGHRLGNEVDRRGPDTCGHERGHDLAPVGVTDGRMATSVGTVLMRPMRMRSSARSRGRTGWWHHGSS